MNQALPFKQENKEGVKKASCLRSSHTGSRCRVILITHCCSSSVKEENPVRVRRLTIESPSRLIETREVEVFNSERELIVLCFLKDATSF